MATNVNKRDADLIFRKLEIEEKKSTHHRAGFIRIDGVRALPIHFSVGRGDMPGRVGDRFRKQLYLNQAEFDRLRGCTMSRDEWVITVLPRLR